jgi:hypothetical protein
VKRHSQRGRSHVKYVTFHNNRNDEVAIADDQVEAVQSVSIRGSLCTKITLHGGDEAIVREDVDTVKRVLAITPEQAA